MPGCDFPPHRSEIFTGAEMVSIAPMPGLDDLKLLSSGKVREIYELDGDLLMVASDRISTYDVVMPTPIPDKGKVLNRMSVFWFGLTEDIVPNHFISEDVPEEVAERAMRVRKLEMYPVECVVRGYLSGSGWKEYKESGSVCGIELPSGLVESDQLPEPIFTPSTKAEIGDHDENVDFDRAAEIVLGDEVLTPDSSRFWPAASYQPGVTPPSFDKQYVRDWASETGWDKKPPAPELPPDVVEQTRAKYVEAYERITNESF